MIDLLKDCVGKEIEVFSFGISVHGCLRQIITDRTLVLEDLTGYYQRSYVKIDAIQGYRVRD